MGLILDETQVNKTLLSWMQQRETKMENADKNNRNLLDMVKKI